MAYSPGEAPLGKSAVTSPDQFLYPPYREPSYELAAIQSANIANLIATVLRKCPRNPPQRIVQESEGLAGFQSPRERLIGFIGNSGAGKSSTLNSILDQDGLARTGACGSAVTPFAAEYRFRQPIHRAPFTLDCKLMVHRDLGEYLGELLREFWHASSVNKTDREGSDQKIYEDSKAARDILEAVFGDMEDFDFDRLSHGDDEDSRNQAKRYLRELCEQLEFPNNMTSEGCWIEESQDAEGCQDHQSFLQDNGLWPLVESLSIFADIAILKHGLTLIDLPGFNDTNLARIRAARKAQSKCDDLCLVVDISRACDTPIIQQNFELIQAKAEAQKSSTINITIICTRSAADLEGNRSLERLVNRSKLNQAKSELKQAQSADEKVKRNAERNLETLLITTRNEKVEKDLEKKYGSYVKGGILKVFCVDNVMYWKATTERERVLSGIPALRQHLGDLPAESLFRATDLFLSKKIPALVGSYATWVESCRIDLELEKRPRLPEASQLRLCLERIRDWVIEMHKVFETCINTPLEKGSRSIRTACLKVAEAWEMWPAGSVGSWVKHFGSYTTGAMGARDWNNELLVCFNNEVMGQSWHHFEVETDPLLIKLENIIAVFEDFTEKCSELQAPGSFLGSLTARLDILRSAFKDARERYLKGAGNIRFNANGAHQDSYIVDCMLETYREASKPTGSGVTKKRHNILQSHVGSEDFVDAFRTLLFEEFREVVNQVSGSISAALEREIEAIESDLEAIQPSKGNERFFKADPAYGEECEDVLSKVIKQLEEVDELAANARAMASERYR